MRVYLPYTLAGLRALHAAGGLPPGTRTAFAVTPALREWYADGNVDELEYAALSAAGRGSLRLLAADPASERRRVVVAADVPEGAVTPAPGLGRAAVTVTGPLALARVAAAHVDDPDAEPAVAAAVAALPGADAGDEDARLAVEETDGFELLWFATQEIPELLG